MNNEKLLQTLDSFSFDKEHNFILDSEGNSDQDLYLTETLALINAGTDLTTLSYRAYKLGYMRAKGLI